MFQGTRGGHVTCWLCLPPDRSVLTTLRVLSPTRKCNLPNDDWPTFLASTLVFQPLISLPASRPASRPSSRDELPCFQNGASSPFSFSAAECVAQAFLLALNRKSSTTIVNARSLHASLILLSTQYDPVLQLRYRVSAGRLQELSTS